MAVALSGPNLWPDESGSSQYSAPNITPSSWWKTGRQARVRSPYETNSRGPHLLASLDPLDQAPQSLPEGHEVVVRQEVGPRAVDSVGAGPHGGGRLVSVALRGDPEGLRLTPPHGIGVVDEGEVLAAVGVVHVARHDPVGLGVQSRHLGEGGWTMFTVPTPTSPPSLICINKVDGHYHHPNTQVGGGEAGIQILWDSSAVHHFILKAPWDNCTSQEVP